MTASRILTLDSDRVNNEGQPEMVAFTESDIAINREDKIAVILGNNYNEVKGIEKS